MTLRSIATPLTIGTFIVVGVTGICMLLGVHGLVNPVHEISSVLFVLGSVLHILVNWKPTAAHLKKPMGASLALICALVTVAALVMPSRKGANPRQAMGQAAELCLGADLGRLADLTGQPQQELMHRLARVGVSAPDAHATLRQIAQANGKQPMVLLAAVLPPAREH
nr:DUF4405 domain-containing protein [uncultured Holophaga sp.]